MSDLRPMSEAPRDGSSIIAKLKPARTPGYQSRRKHHERRIGWSGLCWNDRTVSGAYWGDDDFEGWSAA